MSEFNNAPLTSLRRRQSNIKGSPLLPTRKSVVASTPQIPQVYNDDELERSRRRSNAAFNKKVSSVQNGGTPVSGSPKSAAETPFKPSEGNLQDHFQTCLQMFMDNRMNVKNVWNMHIIDYMQDLLRSKRQAGDILQLACTSLDISAKVYGLRVDDVHNDVLKLANSMARTHAQQQRIADETSSDKENEPESVDGEHQNGKEKKKRRQRTIKATANLAKPETLECDIAADYSLSKKGIYHDNTCLLTSQYLMALHGPGEYCLLCSARCNIPMFAPKTDTKQEIPENIKLPLPVEEPHGEFCAPFKDYVVDVWDLNQEDMSTIVGVGDEAVVYNDEGFAIPEVEPDTNDVMAHHSDHSFASDVEEEVQVAQMHRLGPRPALANLANVQDYNSDEEDKRRNLEYSLAAVMSFVSNTWAGPQHLKHKKKRNTIPTEGAPQQKRSKPVIPEIKYGKYSTEELEDIMRGDEVRICRQSRSIDIDKITLPEDMQITQLQRHCFMLKPGMTWASLNRDSSGASQSNVTNNQVDLNVSNYDYNNPVDAEYCPPPQPNDDHWQADDNDTSHADANISQINTPNQNKKIDLNYAQHAKKIDMKKLKSAVWTSLIYPTENPEEGVVKEMKFSEMYKEVPKKMPEKMREEVSVGLAFSALLHLSNDHSLELISSEDLKDITIKQG